MTRCYGHTFVAKRREVPTGRLWNAYSIRKVRLKTSGLTLPAKLRWGDMKELAEAMTEVGNTGKTTGHRNIGNGLVGLLQQLPSVSHAELKVVPGRGSIDKALVMIRA